MAPPDNNSYFTHVKTHSLYPTYVASDGKSFTCKLSYMNYEDTLSYQRRCWFDKRYSLLGMIRHWLTGYEPQKPYKF